MKTTVSIIFNTQNRAWVNIWKKWWWILKFKAYNEMKVASVDLNITYQTYKSENCWSNIDQYLLLPWGDLYEAGEMLYLPGKVWTSNV